MRPLFPSLLLLLSSCHAKPVPLPPQPPPGEAWLTPEQVREAKLAIAPLGEQDVGNALDTSGKVTFDDLRVAHVYSPVAGRVSKIQAQPGQRVKRGAPLIVIQSPEVGQAVADLAKAQADLVAAEHDFKRQEKLYKDGAAPQKDYEIAQDNYGKTKAELQRALAKAKLLKSGSVNSVTQEYTLTAPIDGEVIARNASPGGEIQGQYSGAGTPVELFTIGELDHVWVVADLYEMDLAKVRQGARVTVAVPAYPNKIFQGHVEWMSSSLDPATRTAKVRCSIANTDHELKPEMYAKVSVSIAEQRALAIPRSALLHFGEQTMVFVQKGPTEDGRLSFVRRPVAVDEDRGGDFLPVTHGLAQGELVVTSGAVLLLGML